MQCYNFIGSPVFYTDISPLPPPYYQGGARKGYPEAWPLQHHSGPPRSSYPQSSFFYSAPMHKLRSWCAQR